jgi:HAD superfamily hydrolase (TIGR01549 family)
MSRLLNSPKVLIFDFDGTLCDSLQSAFEVINSYSDHFGYRKILWEEIPSLKDMTAREIMNSLGISMIQLPQVAYQVKKAMKSRIGKIDPIPGIAQTLQALKAGSYRLGILTSNSEENVREFLEQNGLNLFDFIYANSSIFGKSVVLQRLLKDLKFQPSEVHYVGDEIRDIEAAKSVGVGMISVTWGFNSKKALSSENPDYLLEHPEEFLKFFPALA